MIQALSRIATANRTCSIFIGLGDLYNDEFKVVEYGWQLVNIYNVRYVLRFERRRWCELDDLLAFLCSVQEFPLLQEP